MSLKIRRGGSWIDVGKNVKVRKGNEWVQAKNVYTRKGGVWIPAWKDEIFYEFGTEYVPFVEGYVDGLSENRIIKKESDHLYLYVKGYAFATLVTDYPVNLTGLKTLYVDWDYTVPDGTSNSVFCYLLVGTDKMGDHNSYKARIWRGQGDSGRQISSLNISSLSGNYYIRLATRVILWSSSTFDCSVKIYKVWGE